MAHPAAAASRGLTSLACTLRVPPGSLPAVHPALQHVPRRTPGLREHVRTVCRASTPPGSGRSGNGPHSSRDASSSPSPDSELSVASVKGVGPKIREQLKSNNILSVADLKQLYRRHREDADVLADFMAKEFQIRHLHGKLIAREIGALVRRDRSAEAAAAEEKMVTLAVEGNISAGKSTFLDVLSHEETNLRDMLQVVPEPVAQWQEYRCRDAEGVEKPVNVLEKFYSNPQRFAYSFQHYVLMSRMQADRQSRDCDKALRVVERSIFSDRQVFVRAMHSTKTMEDFEVSVYNTIFDHEVNDDFMLVPDGFVYLRAEPNTCMQRMRRRNRGEESGVSREYLEMLHANHEDWLRDGDSLLNLQRGLASGARGVGGTQAGVLHPASAEQAALVEARVAAGEKLDQWQIQLIENVPEAIKDQVLLLRGDKVPQLRDRLALVLDHDQDVDVQRDREARREYARKIQAFYGFVRQWKSAEQALRDALRSDVERHGGVSLPLRVDGAAAAQMAAR